MHTIVASLVTATVLVQGCPNLQKDAACKDRVEKIVETFLKSDRYLVLLFIEGAPPGVPLTNEWTREVATNRLRYSGELGVFFLVDGPCPAAAKRMILASPDSALRLANELPLWPADAIRNMRESFLQVLELIPKWLAGG